MAARRSTSRRSPQFYAKASGPLSRESLYEILVAAEPAYRAYLDANTGTLWSLKGIEGPTENGETLVTWTSPNGGALVLYAIAVTEKLVEVRLFAGDEQPRGKRVPVDALDKPGVVLASLLAGRVPWARENPKTELEPAFRRPGNGFIETHTPDEYEVVYPTPSAAGRVGPRRRAARENPLDQARVETHAGGRAIYVSPWLDRVSAEQLAARKRSECDHEVRVVPRGPTDNPRATENPLDTSAPDGSHVLIRDGVVVDVLPWDGPGFRYPEPEAVAAAREALRDKAIARAYEIGALSYERRNPNWLESDHESFAARELSPSDVEIVTPVGTFVLEARRDPRKQNGSPVVSVNGRLNPPEREGEPWYFQPSSFQYADGSNSGFLGSYPRPLRNPVVRRHATSNPLDTSVSSDGWTHWHGDPPDEVGNLGPGQQIQTADGWWYRQDTGPDAGKLYFQAAGGMLAPVETVEYVETEIPIEALENRLVVTNPGRSRENPLVNSAPGLQTSPPVGARVRLTGKFLKNTGQHRGTEGTKVWTVLGHSGPFVIVNEEADISYFTPAELVADPSLKWRRINRANLQIVGAPPRAEDLP